MTSPSAATVSKSLFAALSGTAPPAAPTHQHLLGLLLLPQPVAAAAEDARVQMRDGPQDEQEGSDSEATQQLQPAAKRQRPGSLDPVDGQQGTSAAATAGHAGSAGCTVDAQGGQSSGRRPSLLDAYIIRQQPQQAASAPGAHLLPGAGLGAEPASGIGGVPVVKSSR